jgi:hypothetical protein
MSSQDMIYIIFQHTSSSKNSLNLILAHVHITLHLIFIKLIEMMRFKFITT